MADDVAVPLINIRHVLAPLELKYHPLPSDKHVDPTHPCAVNRDVDLQLWLRQPGKDVEETQM